MRWMTWRALSISPLSISPLSTSPLSISPHLQSIQEPVVRRELAAEIRAVESKLVVGDDVHLERILNVPQVDHEGAVR